MPAQVAAPRRVIAYCRVSTGEQAKGRSLEDQEATLREHAEAAGLDLVAVLRDEGRSGTGEEWERPGLAEALDRVRSGEPDALLVPALDRLARDLGIQEMILRDLRRSGRELLSVAEPDIDGEDGTRTLIRQVLGAVSQYEAWLTQQRLRSGRRRKAADGGYVGGRRLRRRYGYRLARLEDGGFEYESVPSETREIERMQHARQKGRTLQQIADRLNARKVPGSGGRLGTWNPSTVRKILAREGAGMRG